ncbi:MAG: type II restriction endonuclease subunit R [Bacteroidetes bacterium]|nr:MAG: type II restriction endonuclease subunit R [Bacteroidota bacterium]
MKTSIESLFTDKTTVDKVQQKLPKLFQVAELETTRGGKVGMEVGSLRERVLVALLIHQFGEENVKTDIPITAAEADVFVFDKAFSIKTLSNSLSGLKLIWTVDAQSAFKFSQEYEPSCDMIFVHINWSKHGGLYCIPKKVQLEIFNKIGRNEYIKLPKEGTNPRGVEMQGKALKSLVTHTDTLKIDIHWEKEKIDFDVFERWIELWAEDDE